MVDSSSSGSWKDFQDLCIDIASVSSRLSKTEKVRYFVDDYNGDLKVFLKLILPKVSKRVYQMNKKKMIKLFSSVFNIHQSKLDDMMIGGEHSGYLGKAVSHFFDKSMCNFKNRNKKTILSMKEIDDYLDEFTKLTQEEPQKSLLTKIVNKCNKNDLLWFVRELDRDLKIGAGNKAVFDGLGNKAYDTFLTKSSIDYIVNKLALNQSLTISADLMTPMKPMLASACKSYDMAFKKCKSGVIYAEIKYDGERVQIHWNGQDWKFYSRSLKAVIPSKIAHVKDDVPLSCPNAKSLILDSEILMVDMKTGKPLPFTSLGKHKRMQFDDSCPCLFVFDILYFNGDSLINKPLMERRNLLEKEFKTIKNKIHLSDLTIIRTKSDLRDLMSKMISDNQEGLVLKDSKSVYGPNKRHWLKMKKDYLADGAIADSADLVVLGAYRGTGKHGGLYSTFLMGTLDTDLQQFKTVCKAHNGLNDEQIQHYTDTLKMNSFDASDCPSWLNVHTSLYPDWVARNPKKSPIFEISGFEFSASKVHTATDNKGEGFSIRFPRVTKIRTDKKYSDATNLKELRHLVKTSRDDPGAALREHNEKHFGDKNDGKVDCEDEDSNSDVNGNSNGNNAIKKPNRVHINPKKRKQLTLTTMMDRPIKKRKLSDKNEGGSGNACDYDQNMKDNDANGNDDDGGGGGGSDNDDIAMIDVTCDKGKVNRRATSPPLWAPSSPKVVYDKRGNCGYDDGCYRKNPKHFEEFAHPKKEKKEMDKLRAKTMEKIKVNKKKYDSKNESESMKRDMLEHDAKKEFDELVADAKKPYDEKVKLYTNEYEFNMNEAKKVLEEQVEAIKQTEAFEMEKIEKKYHPK